MFRYVEHLIKEEGMDESEAVEKGNIIFKSIPMGKGSRKPPMKLVATAFKQKLQQLGVACRGRPRKKSVVRSRRIPTTDRLVQESATATATHTIVDLMESSSCTSTSPPLSPRNPPEGPVKQDALNSLVAMFESNGPEQDGVQVVDPAPVQQRHGPIPDAGVPTPQQASRTRQPSPAAALPNLVSAELRMEFERKA